MSEETKTPITAEPKTRRQFVRTAAGIAVTAPAVAVLLSGTTIPTAAQAAYEHTFTPGGTVNAIDDPTNNLGDLGGTGDVF